MDFKEILIFGAAGLVSLGLVFGFYAALIWFAAKMFGF